MELGNMFFGNSRGEFPINRELSGLFREIQKHFDFDPFGVPQSKTKLKVEERLTSEGKKYEVLVHDKFEFFPYYYGDDEEICGLPNFIYKPKRIEISWYKYPFRDSYCNVELTEKLLEEIVNDCIT